MLFCINLNAQSPCDHDSCFDENNYPWTSVVTTMYLNPTVCPDCWVIITYRYRLNVNCPMPPSDPVEFEILNFVVSGACWVQGCFNLNNPNILSSI